MSESLSKIDFFNSYFELLKSRGIASVILHTYKAYPEHIHSDVDYCVSDGDLAEIIPLVDEHCQKSGWRLVQIMQHESKAFFCICVSKYDSSEYLELDVCSDYMREGKILIRAEDLLAGRRCLRDKHFYVPSPGAEFCYGLWKSVAKKKSTQMMFDQLNTLYDRDPENCLNAMVDLGIFESHHNAQYWKTQGEKIYSNLVSRYNKMPVASQKRQLQRLYSRVVNPSGLVILLPSRESKNETDLILNACRHAFRKTARSKKSDSPAATWKIMLRSTLVLYEGKGFSRWLLCTLAARFDALLQLGTGSLDQKTNQIFEYLEVRLVKRWGLR